MDGTAGLPALGTVSTGACLMSGDVELVSGCGCDCGDLTARHRAKLVHAILYGHPVRQDQTSVPNRYDPRKVRMKHLRGRYPGNDDPQHGKRRENQITSTTDTPHNSRRTT